MNSRTRLQLMRPKRILDLTVSVVLFVLLLPLVLVTVIGIWLQDGGDPLYSQVRLGKHGRRFRMWKFRTMSSDADARRGELVANSGQRRFKQHNDPRVTPIGRVLRRWSIDEIPQLFNVLKGDMSLVGPRPPLPEEAAKYSAREMRRLDGVPGLTGPWQVEGRAEIPFERQVELDISYLETQGLLRDVKLLLKTIPSVLVGRGAW